MREIIVSSMAVLSIFCLMAFGVQSAVAQNSKKSTGFSQLDFDSDEAPSKREKKAPGVVYEEPIFKERIKRSMGVQKKEKKVMTLEQQRWSEIKERARRDAAEKEEKKNTIRVLNTEDLIKESKSLDEKAAGN